MIVAVEGSIFHLQDRGGISRIYHEVLPRMVALDNSLEIHLLLFDDPRQKLPTHSRIIRHRLPIERFLARNRRISRLTLGIESILSRMIFPSTRHVVWHPTYYGHAAGWRGPRVALVADMIHEVLPDLFNSREEIQFSQRKRRCIVGADVVICISNSTRDDVLRFVPQVEPERLEVVHLAHSEVFAAVPGHMGQRAPDADKPFILTFGSNNPYKGFLDLVQAFQDWHLADTFDLGVVGTGPFEGISQQTEHLRFFGPVDDPALRDLYHRAAAFIYPSRYEGFGIPLLEAMACGCPVAASRIPSTIEVAEDLPVYFEAGNRHSTIEALTRCVGRGRDHPSTARGLEHARRFTWEKTARRILDIYQSLIQDPDRVRLDRR